MLVKNFNITQDIENYKNNFINVIYVLMYYGIAIILFSSGIMKIVDPIPLMETLKTFFHFSNTENLMFITILSSIEISIAVLLIINKLQKQILFIATILIFCFLLFAVYGSIIGNSVDCGCFGSIVKSEFGLNMIIRNFLFFLMSSSVFIMKVRKNV